jgi:hypothetical protein
MWFVHFFQVNSWIDLTKKNSIFMSFGNIIENSWKSYL